MFTGVGQSSQFFAATAVANAIAAALAPKIHACFRMILIHDFLAQVLTERA